jgi:hypothetical protein
MEINVDIGRPDWPAIASGAGSAAIAIRFSDADRQLSPKPGHSNPPSRDFNKRQVSGSTILTPNDDKWRTKLPRMPQTAPT